MSPQFIEMFLAYESGKEMLQWGYLSGFVRSFIQVKYDDVDMDKSCEVETMDEETKKEKKKEEAEEEKRKEDRKQKMEGSLYLLFYLQFLVFICDFWFFLNSFGGT